MSTSGSTRIPGEIQESLNKKYRKVLDIGGRIDIGGPEKMIDKDIKRYYVVNVKLLLSGEHIQTLYVGTGKDDKDTKGAYEDLLSKLGVKVPSTVKDEKDLRQMAHNDLGKKYINATVVNELVFGGKAMVKVTVQNGGIVSQGKGRTIDEAYNNIPRV